MGVVVAQAVAVEAVVEVVEVEEAAAAAEEAVVNRTLHASTRISLYFPPTASSHDF